MTSTRRRGHSVSYLRSEERSRARIEWVKCVGTIARGLSYLPASDPCVSDWRTHRFRQILLRRLDETPDTVELPTDLRASTRHLQAISIRREAKCAAPSGVTGTSGVDALCRTRPIIAHSNPREQPSFGVRRPGVAVPGASPERRQVRWPEFSRVSTNVRFQGHCGHRRTIVQAVSPDAIHRSHSSAAVIADFVEQAHRIQGAVVRSSRDRGKRRPRLSQSVLEHVVDLPAPTRRSTSGSGPVDGCHSQIDFKSMDSPRAGMAIAPVRDRLWEITHVDDVRS